MASIGLYRYKIVKATVGKYPVFFRRNGVVEATQCVEFKPFCSGGKILKFMDRNGLYCFFPFNEYWEESFKPDMIGETEYSIDSLRTAQSGTRNIGYEMISREIEKIPNEKVRELTRRHVADIRSSNRRDFRF